MPASSAGSPPNEARGTPSTGADPVDQATRDLLRPPQLPRSAQYPLHWQVTNAMGPNPIWLTELLTQAMDLRPGQRVLDLGCGRAATSIFLAREQAVRVWAADLWIAPTDNWARIETADLAERVFPIFAEAHALPFADGYFDAIISIDAYHYFGTDALCLERVTRLLRPGGQLGIAVPGLRRELSGARPPHLLTCFSGSELGTLHSPRWWRSHWAATGLVDVLRADPVPDGLDLWRRWDEGCLAYGRATGSWPQGPDANPGSGIEQELRMLDADAGKTLDLVRVIARRRD